MMRHYNIRPFSCAQCSQTFYQQKELDGHVATKHSDERPFQCPSCSGAFKSKAALYHHSMRVHKQNYAALYVQRSAPKPLPRHVEPLGDEELRHVLVEDFKLGQFNDLIPCPLCTGTFTKRINMYHHGSLIHKRDFWSLLEEGLQKKGIDMANHLLALKNAEQMDEHGRIMENINGVLRQDLLKHLGNLYETKTSKDSVECPVCQKLFMQRSSLFSHGKSVHGFNFSILLKEYRKRKTLDTENM